MRLALLIGFGLGRLGGAYALLGFLIASVLGSIVGMALIAMGKAGRRPIYRSARSSPPVRCFPALAGGPVVNWYLGLVH